MDEHLEDDSIDGHLAIDNGEDEVEEEEMEEALNPLYGTPLKKKRRKWTNRQKLKFVQKVEELIEQGLSQTQACKQLNIPAQQLRQWKKQVEQLADSRPDAMTTCDGMPGFLEQVNDELVSYVFELREMGIPVRNNMIRLKGIELKPEFGNKSRNAQEKVVERWVKKSPFVRRMGTGESQRNPKEIVADAMEFIENTVRPKIAAPNRHEDYIINMDQTPVYFSMESKKTLEVLGAKTVNIRVGTTDTKRCTYAAAITASGLQLQPYIIFKGTTHGKIAKKEIPKYDKTMLYATQKKAWMDELCMLDWVDRVLAPHLEQAPSWVAP